MRIGNFFRESGVIAATTIGAGIFGLPYVFLKSGVASGVFYLIILSFVVIFAHTIYWRVLQSTEEKKRLLGLVREFLGKYWYRLGVCAIIFGLLLTLVIYIVLGGQFMKMVFPSLDLTLAAVIFWFLSAAPLFAGERKFATLEILGVIMMAGIILLIFFSAIPNAHAIPFKVSSLSDAFMPFGIVLFSLAGWTAVEPLFYAKKKEDVSRTPVLSFIFGTLASALLYLIFVLGIFWSAFKVTPDTISGLSDWPRWKFDVLGVLGLFAIWTSYLPIGTEIKNSFRLDLRWRPDVSAFAAASVPMVLVFFGFSNFLKVVGLAGGVFLGLQYVLIVLVGRHALKLGRAGRILADLVIFSFISAAVYEVYYFVVS